MKEKKSEKTTDISFQNTNNKSEESYEFYKVLSSINDPEEMRLLLEDLCTYKELEYLVQRLNSAIMLLKGATYQQVGETVDNISTATLSRVSRCIKHGSGGYSDVLKKYIEMENETNAKNNS